MGYNTEFSGEIKISPKLSDNLMVLIIELNRTRRVMRNRSALPAAPSWVNDGEWGIQGEFYTAILAEMARNNITPDQYINNDSIRLDLINRLDCNCGQYDQLGVINDNLPPKTQPGLWLGWTLEDNSTIIWDGCEKFYNYIEWLQYLIDLIFQPNEYFLNGEVGYQGDDPSDRGTIEVINNQIRVNLDESSDIQEDDSDENNSDDEFNNSLLVPMKIVDSDHIYTTKSA